MATEKSKRNWKALKMPLPYHQSDEIPTKMQSRIKNGSEGPKNIYKNEMSDPLSTENVLKLYMKYQNLAIESNNKKSLEIIENMQKAKMEIAESNQENAYLKKR